MHIYVKSILAALNARHDLKLVLTLLPPDYDVDAEITFHMPSNPSFKTNLSLQVGAGYCILNEYGHDSTGEVNSVRTVATYDQQAIYQTNGWAGEILSKVVGRDIISPTGFSK